MKKFLSKKSFLAILTTLVFAFGVQAAFATNYLGDVSGTCGSCDTSDVCDVCEINNECDTCDVDCDVCPGINNTVTGPDSINVNEINIDQNSSFVVDNIATACDEYAFDVETGNNNVDSNTSIGVIETGSIIGSVSVDRSLNNIDIEIPDFGQPIVINGSVANNMTGPGSENINNVNIDSSNRVAINNVAEYSARYDVDANTGKNKINNNTVVGGLVTGDIEIGINEDVSLNNGSSSITMPAPSPIVVPDLGNNITGPDSTNTNSFDYSQRNRVQVNNVATISNNIEVDANTGNNTIRDNTCVGDIRTGDVRFDFNISSSAN